MDIRNANVIDIHDEEGQETRFFRSAHDEWTCEGGDIFDEQTIVTMIYSGAWRLI